MDAVYLPLSAWASLAVSAIRPAETAAGTWPEIAAAGGTVAAVIVALFKDEWVRWWRRADLVVEIELTPPHCHKTTEWLLDERRVPIQSWDCYYLRLWVKNDGKSRAEKVQVYLAKVDRRKADGTLARVRRFLPMNLRWSHAGFREAEIYADGIAPKMGKHCDLGHVPDPRFRRSAGCDLSRVQEVPPAETILFLDLEMPPSTLGHLLEPGVYRLELLVAAANCAPVTKVVELALTGQWHADEGRMFTEGIRVHVQP